MRGDLIKALNDNQAAFGIELDEGQIESLVRYFELIQEHNALLHLVAPMPAAEFAVRHILESLTLLSRFPMTATFADVGAGAGLPSIPCLIARAGLRAMLIESKEKKAVFLNETVKALNLGERASVVNRQFEEIDLTGVSVVACRALDKFTEKLPRLLKWAGNRELLLFGGNNLKEALVAAGRSFDEVLMPLSERRYLFIVAKTMPSRA